MPKNWDSPFTSTYQKFPGLKSSPGTYDPERSGTGSEGALPEKFYEAPQPSSDINFDSPMTKSMLADVPSQTPAETSFVEGGWNTSIYDSPFKSTVMKKK